MIIVCEYSNGKSKRFEVNDANVAAFLARLNGNSKWIDANGDEKKLINIEAVQTIEIQS